MATCAASAATEGVRQPVPHLGEAEEEHDHGDVRSEGGDERPERGVRDLCHTWCTGSAVHLVEGARCGSAPCVALSETKREGRRARPTAAAASSTPKPLESEASTCERWAWVGRVYS